MQRQFSSGSRQAPDPFDQFLEGNNFYRKHTARDASCLFRVISEQMYDTQRHHLEIRKKCVQYMRKYSDVYQTLIDGDLFEYLLDLSKPKTFGTLVELQAVGKMFERNILLFQPYNLGNYLNKSKHFNKVFRVFYTPERHFDSVFTADYIKDAAICQSICYDILYKEIFRLPDVSYAVEQMLHSSSETSEAYYENDDAGYCTRIYYRDGRVFDMDLPDSTNCILENYEWCHFHCDNFPRIKNEVQDELVNYGNGNKCYKDSNYMLTLNKTVDAFLPEKYVSCVRQLLDEGITPFPYKVAKALDPNMYRNIEFDAWNESRKETKYINWYNGDTNFKVGAKCYVRLHKSEKELYICHIQEISVDKGYCMVFVEKLGEKRLVPYDALSPLPPEEFKPWSLPYSLQRKVLRSKSIKYSASQFYCQLRMNESYTDNLRHGGGKQSLYMPPYKYDHVSRRNAAAYYTLQHLVHLDHFPGQNVQYCTMPLTVTHDNANGRNANSPNELDVNNNNMPRSILTNTTATNMVPQNDNSVTLSRQSMELPESSDIGHEVAEIPNIAVPQYPCVYAEDVNYCFGYANRGTVYYVNNQQVPSYASNMYMPYAAGSMAPAEQAVYMPSPSTELNMAHVQYDYGADGDHETPALRDLRLGNTGMTNAGVLVRTAPELINWEANPSLETFGEDLPNDSATLRYFYNLGIEYHRQMKTKNAKNHSEQEGKPVKELTNEFHDLKLDEDTTKSEADTNNNSTNVNNSNATKSMNYKNNGLKNNNHVNTGGGNNLQYSSQNNLQTAGGTRGSYQGRRGNSRYYYNRERQQTRFVNADTNGGRNEAMNHYSHSYRGGHVANGNSGNGGGVVHDTKPNYKNPFNHYRKHGSLNYMHNNQQQSLHTNYATHQRPPPAIIAPPTVSHGEHSPNSVNSLAQDTQNTEGGSVHSQNLSTEALNVQISNNYSQPPPPLGVIGNNFSGCTDMSGYSGGEFVGQPITMSAGGNNFCVPLSPYNQSPYGVYSMPPPIPGYMPGSPFMPPPPQPAQYANGVPYNVNNEYVEQHDPVAPPMPYYSYQPMPLYYASSTGLPNAPPPHVAPPTPSSQNYWCVPPPPTMHVGNTIIPTLSTVQLPTMSINSSISSSTTRSQTPTTYTSPIGNTFNRTLAPLTQNLLNNAKYTDTGNKTARREKNV